jgi:hypothetical protein
MGFNPLTYARLAEKTFNKQNPVKTFLTMLIYNALTYINLPYKMRLLNNRIDKYNKRLESLENMINGKPEKEKKGNNFNVIR